MKEYIERVAVLNLLEKINPVDYGSMFDYQAHRAVSECLREARYGVESIPAADVAEVRHGRWIPKINHTYMPVEYDENGAPILHRYTSYYCSLCGREEAKEEPYCHCGARMDKEDVHEVS